MGHIEKRNGRYRARYRDPLGKQRCRTFTRKADAERFLRETRVDMDRGLWLDPRAASVPLAIWAEEFLRFARRLSPSTQETYRRDLDRYILPALGDLRIGAMPAADIEHWLNDEIDAGLASSSVHRHYRTLRRVLQVAVEKERIAANPCHRVQPPRVIRREMAFLSWDEVVRLAEAIHPRYRALIYVAVDTGMRWSELVGLRRQRVDLVQRKVRVTEQLIRLQAGEWIRKEPKTTAGVRSITISSGTALLLAGHIEDHCEAGADALVFPNQAGKPLISSSFWQHYFKPALDETGLSIRFHDLRHTCVALAICGGAYPKTIQTRMGHSSINVTLDRYGHLLPELDEAIAADFGQRLADAQRAREQQATVLRPDFGNTSGGG